MDLLSQIVARAQSNKQRIVLPEAEEERTLCAADKALADNLADIILIGNPAKVEALAKEKGLKNIGKASLIDPENYDRSEELAEKLAEIRKSKGMTIEEARKLIKNPLYLGCMIIKTEGADGQISGALSTTGDTLRPALHQSQIASLQSQISALENENAELIRKISSASVEDALIYRQQYNANKDRITQQKSQLSDWQGKLTDLQQAKAEAAEGEAAQTDDYYRIPAIMQDCKTAYNLTWNGNGSWSGNTFTRTASMPNINGTITFKATVSIARRPKYFLGIKIHRAIVQISWELTTEYSDTQVVVVMELDSDKSDAEKAAEVNAKIAETAREFPGCEVSMEYARNEPAQTDDTEDTYHLLWSCDRLEIARQIDTRLTNIYADLVSLEKMMTYKHDIIDILKAVLPYINEDDGRRLTLVEQCRKRWLRNAANSKHSDSYSGKYEEDREEEDE